ncbi:hypothetical protein EBU24_02270 [bacterium]|nr:hypothetical protein [bacterium]
MKFQISFDLIDVEKQIEIAKKIINYADIFEVGTLPIFKHGIHAIERFKQEFPKKTILADTKVVDRGRDVASIFSQAGADWISVMGGTSQNVIHGACAKAHDLGKKVILDLIDSNSPGQTALEANSLGADALLFHQAHDETGGLSILEHWEMVRGNTNLPIFVSAKITRETLDQILHLKPDGIIVGRAITEHEDPETEAKFFFDKCKNS